MENTFVAGTLPAFMISIVYTKTSPTVATAVFTDFTTSKFPDCTVVFTMLLGTLIVTVVHSDSLENLLLHSPDLKYLHFLDPVQLIHQM